MTRAVTTRGVFAGSFYWGRFFRRLCGISGVPPFRDGVPVLRGWGLADRPSTSLARYLLCS